jgi:hypothetical protein
VVLAPLRREVEGDLREVVGHDLTGGHVDDGRHRDAAVVLGEPSEVGLLEPLDPEYWVDAAWVEVESPAALVMRWAAEAHRDHILEPQQPTHDDRAVRPWTRAGRDEAVAPRLDRVAVCSIFGDASRYVVGVAVELLV